MVQLWRYAFDDDTYVEASIDDLSRYRDLRLTAGILLRDQFPQSASVTVTAGRITDYFECGVMRLVSPELADALRASGARAEFLPVRVKDSRDGHTLSYCLWNLLETVDCFDRDKSKFQDFHGFAAEIKRFVVRLPASKYPAVFRIDRTAPPQIAARRDFADLIKSRNFSGVLFEDILNSGG